VGLPRQAAEHEPRRALDAGLQPGLQHARHHGRRVGVHAQRADPQGARRGPVPLLRLLHHVYYVSFTTVDPVGPLGELTYEIRSRGQLIKPIPTPKPTSAIHGLTISAGFTALDGVDYPIGAHRAGSNRQFGQRCGEIGDVVNCQVTVLTGTWNVSIVPLGLKATGTPAKTQLTVAAPVS
jgi:hypothetical protein